MARALLSWIAYTHDFAGDGGAMTVNPDGPTAALHAHFWHYDRHVLLTQNTAERGDPRAVTLLSYLQRAHPRHPVEVRYMGVRDVIDVREIKEKAERLLAELHDTEVDVYVSPGTPAMQVAWYLAALSRRGVRLFQVRPARYSASGLPEQVFFEAEASAGVAALVLREEAPPGSAGIFMGPTLQQVYARAEKLAATDRVTAFLLGESGTGKERLARYVHTRSTRGEGPFVALNCAAFRTDELLESRLFGYRKGAFTGAERDTPGLLEAADGGTLFLDEIGDVSPAFQAVLLRVLQEREFSRVGEARVRRVDARVIAATHRDLVQRCAEGAFRWDLYYRLAVADVTIPPLRAWPVSEVEALLDHLLARKAEAFDRSPLVVTPPARRVLLGYAWPGNVREMEHLVERLYVFADTSVQPDDLPARMAEPGASATLLLADAERAHIVRVYERFEQNKQRTAQALGIALNTLKSRLRSYDVA